MSFLLNDRYQKKKERKKGRKKERNKECLIPFIRQVYTIMNSFIFFFMIYEARRYTRYQSYRQQEGNTMQMKSKLYLRTILLIDYTRQESLFVYVEQFLVKHAAPRFSVRENVTIKKEKRKERVTPRQTDISGPVPVSFLSRSSMYYITLTLHNPINLLNVISTNSFS